MKYLLWLGIIGLVWWWWRKRPEAGAGPVVESPSAAENMVPCAHCGVYLPEDDALPANGKVYCSEAHRRAAAAGKH